MRAECYADGRTDTTKFQSLLAILRSRLKSNAAIWVNKMCRLSHLTSKYINITVNGNNQQSIDTKRMATTYTINQEPKFLYLKKQKLKEQLYQMHLQCAHQWSSTWNHIQDTINNQQRIMTEKLCTKHSTANSTLYERPYVRKQYINQNIMRITQTKLPL
jgi:hypothetical protein